MELEREARRRKTSFSAVLDLAAREWLTKSNATNTGSEEQRQLRQAALKCFGVLATGERAWLGERESAVRAAPVAPEWTADVLIDTGAILALLDRKDRWHQVCVNAF